MSDDMDFVYAVSDNYILLDKGRIIKSGEIDEIKHEDRRENHNVDDRKQRSPHSRLSLPAFTADV